MIKLSISRGLAVIIAAIIAICLIVGSIPASYALGDDLTDEESSGSRLSKSRDGMLDGNSFNYNNGSPIIDSRNWEGRIGVRLHLGGDQIIVVFVDAREHLSSKGDVVVSFKSTYTRVNSDIKCDILEFSAYIEFTSDIGLKAYASCYANNKSSGKFTRSTTFWHNARTDVWITVKSVSGITRIAKFEFVMPEPENDEIWDF